MMPGNWLLSRLYSQFGLPLPLVDPCATSGWFCFLHTPPILRLKSGESASSSNSASQLRRKHQIQILELSGFSIKSCRQQTLIGRHSGKNMGKGASSSSSERVIATSVSTFPKGKSNTCPAGFRKGFKKNILLSHFHLFKIEWLPPFWPMEWK